MENIATMLEGTQPSPGTVNFLPALWCFAVAALLLAFWLFALIFCIRVEPSQGGAKILWLLVIILLNVIGALIYFGVRRRQVLRDLWP